MCYQVQNEKFDKIIVGEFYDNDGKRIKGIFTTVDDSCAVININVLDRLLSGVKILEGSNEDLTLEKAEEKFGEEIIKKYLSSHGVADIFSLEEVDAAYGNQIVKKHSENTILKAHNASMKNQKKAVRASIEKGKSNQAVIIKAVLEGLTKQEIEYRYGFSRPTINKALKNLDKDTFESIWYKYRTTIFEGVDMKTYVDFELCHYDYKEYLKKINFNKSVEIRHNVERTIKNMEGERKAEAKIKEISEKMQADGYSPVSELKGVAQDPVTEEDDYFNQIVAMCHEPIKDSKPVIIRNKSEEDDKFVEKYDWKKQEQIRGRFSPKTKAGITFAGANENIDCISEIDEDYKEPEIYQGSYDVE